MKQHKYQILAIPVAIRTQYRTPRCHILIHLPYIPGPPKENNAINNLFDVHIPYLRLHDPGHVDQFLRHTLQLDSSRSTGPSTGTSINNLSFPLDFNDVTIRDIAQCYAKGGSLSVDIENDQLNREYPAPLWVKFKKFLQNLFKRIASRIKVIYGYP